MVNDEIVAQIATWAEEHIARAPDDLKDTAWKETLIDTRAIRDCLAARERIPTALHLSSKATWEEIVRRVEALQP